MTDITHVNFQLTQKFDGNYVVSVAPGGCGIDLYEREEYRTWTGVRDVGGRWVLVDRLTHVSTFDDLDEVEQELLS